MAVNPCSSITSGLSGVACGSNPGGVSEIYLANFEDVTFTLTGGTVSAIVGASGATSDFMYPYTFRRNTASVNEDLTKDIATGSLFYTQTGTIVLDKQEKTKRDELMLLDNALIIYIAKHTNGSYWLYGAEDGAYVTTNAATTGTAKTDQNGYTITLIAEEPNRAYPIDSTIIAGIVA